MCQSAESKHFRKKHCFLGSSVCQEIVRWLFATKRSHGQGSDNTAPIGLEEANKSRAEEIVKFQGVL